MAKQLNCGDVGFDCNAQFNADTEEEIMAQASEHAMSTHGMSESELQEQEGAIRGAIRDV
jgi:predicted small metal-binding protein